MTLSVIVTVFIDDREAAGHGERGHVQDRGAGETADAKKQGPGIYQGEAPALSTHICL